MEVLPWLSLTAMGDSFSKNKQLGHICFFSRHIGASRGQYFNLGTAELLDHYCVGGSDKGVFKKTRIYTFQLPHNVLVSRFQDCS